MPACRHPLRARPLRVLARIVAPVLAAVLALVLPTVASAAITGIDVTTEYRQATISWTSSANGTSELRYGTTPTTDWTLLPTVVPSVIVSSKRHSRTLVDLAPGTYYFQVRSSGDTSTTQSFTISEPTPTPLDRLMVDGDITAMTSNGTTAWFAGTFRHVGRRDGSGVNINVANGEREGGTPRIDGPIKVAIDDGVGGQYIAGTFTKVGGVARPGFAHLLPDGGLDADFDPTSSGIAPGTINAMTMVGSKLFVGGSFTTPRNYLAEIEPSNGSVATGFNVGAGTNGPITALAHNPAVNGQLYVGGDFSTYKGGPVHDVMRIDPTGAGSQSVFHDMAGLSGADDGQVTALAVTPDAVYVAGSFTTFDGANRKGIAALDLVVGSTTVATNLTTDGSVDALALSPSGTTLYLGGSFGSVNGLPSKNVASIVTATGAPDTNFAPNLLPGPANRVTALAASSGRLYIAGNFVGHDGVAANRITAVLTSTGARDGGFTANQGLNDSVRTMVLRGDRLFIGGAFTSYDGARRDRLAAVSLETGEPTSFMEGKVGPAGGAAVIHALSIHGTDLWLGGSFTSVAGQQFANLGRIHSVSATKSGTFSLLGGGPNGPVTSIVAKSDGAFIGGQFTQIIKMTPDIVGVNCTNCNGVADIDPNGDPYAGYRFAGPAPSNVAALALIPFNRLFVGGNFTNYNGVGHNGLVGLVSSSGALLDEPGDADFNHLDGGVPGSGASALLVDGTSLFVGSDASTYRGITRNRIAKVDVNTGSLVPGFNSGSNTGFTDGKVTSFAKSGSRLYVGGTFTTYSSRSVNKIAVLNATTGALDSTVTPVPAGGDVKAIYTDNDDGNAHDNMLVGGTFTSVGGKATGGLALFDRVVDRTPPTARITSIVDVAGPSDGIHVDGTKVIVKSTGGTRSFQVKLQAFDAVPSPVAQPGTVSGLRDVTWPTVSDARGTWSPTVATTSGAAQGLKIDCWNTPSMTGAATGSGIDRERPLNWTQFERPDQYPSLPASLAYPAHSTPSRVGDLGCRWKGHVITPTSTPGPYVFTARSSERFKAIIGHDADYPIEPDAVVDDQTPHGPSESNPTSIGTNLRAGTARKVDAEWTSTRGDSEAILRWDPPGTPPAAAIPADAYVTGVDYATTYTLSGGASTTPSTDVNIDATDNGSNTTAAPLQLGIDNDAPAATALASSPAVGPTSDPTVQLAIGTPGADVGEAGIQDRELQRRTRTANAAGACTGTIGAWTSVQVWTGSVPTTFDDAPLADGCYQYQLVARDNVGNVRESLQSGVTDPNADWIRIDTVAPTAASGVIDGDASDSDIAVALDQAKAAWTASGSVDVTSYELCLSATTTCSGEVVRSFTDVGAVNGAAWTGLSMQSGHRYYFTVRARDAAGNRSPAAASDGFDVDGTPAGVNPAGGPLKGIVTLSGPVNGLLDLTGSLGVLSLKVTNTVTGDELSPCTPDIDGSTWDCEWNTVSVLDGSWQLSIVAASILGGGLPINQGLPMIVDNSAPDHTGAVITRGTNPQWSYVGGVPNVAWINPLHGGSLHVTVAATDPQNVNYTFLGLGPGWTPESTTSSSVGTRELAWTTAIGQPTESVDLSSSVTVADSLLNANTASYTIRADATKPTGGAIDQHPGPVSVPNVTVTPATDSGSGIASSHVERESAPTIDPDTCDTTAWRNDWTTVTLPDTAVTVGECYRYRLVAVDNVGNSETFMGSDAVLISTYSVQVTNSLTLVEGGVTGSYSMRLRRPPASDVTLDITSDADQVRLYDAADQPITQLVFTPSNWSTPQSVYASAIDDPVDESDPHASTISHAIAGDPSYATPTPLVLSASITDNDTAAVVVDATGGLTLSENDPTGDTYEVKLATRPVGGDVKVAIPGTGQASATPSLLTFTAGDWSTPQQVTVKPVDDALVEGPHSTTIEATVDSVDANYHQITVAAVPATIADNDEAGIEVEEPATALLAEADAARTATYRVRLTAEPRHPVTISVADALGQVDVQPAAIVIAPSSWNAWTPVVVTARQDAIAEPNPHASRVVFTPSGLDGKFTALTPIAADQEIVEDDVAAYATTLGASWTRADGGVVKVGENDGTGATITIAPRTAPNAAITVSPVLSHPERFAVSPASATIEPGAPQAVTFTVRPIDNAVDAADLAATIAWNTSTVEAIYSSVRIEDTTFTIVDDEAAPIERTVRETPTPPVDNGTPAKDPVKPVDTPPTPDAQTPPSPTPGTPVADAPTAGTPTPDATTQPLQPQDTAPVQDTGSTPPSEREPREQAAPSKAKPHRSSIARAKDWAKEHKGAAASAGVATVAVAAVAAKALAAKGLVGMFQGIPGIENVSDHLRHLRPRRFRKDAERLRKLRDRNRSRKGGSERLREGRRRRRRRDEDPMTEIFERLEGNYGADGPDLLDRLEGRVPTDAVDILDVHDASTNAGFELDLDDYDGRAA